MHTFARLGAGVVDRQPVAAMADGEMPGQVAPEVKLLFGVASFLRELGQQLLRQFVYCIIELIAGHDAVHQAPLVGLPGGDLLVEEQDLARPAVADNQRQELRGSGQGHAAVARAHLTNVDIVGGDGQVAAHVELIATADHGPVEARDRRLADVAQPLVAVNEPTHPFPIVARALEELLLLLQVGACAKGPVAGARQDKNTDLIVPTDVLEGQRQLFQHGVVNRVHHFGSVERDGRYAAVLLVADGLEVKLSRLAADVLALSHKCQPPSFVPSSCHVLSVPSRPRAAGPVCRCS